MNNFLRSVLAPLLLLCSTTSVFAAGSDAASSHPFRMSSEINAATMKAMGGNKQGATAQNKAQTADAPAKQGKVIEVLNAEDFSYLHIESDNSKIWVAGIKVQVKAGDTISYVENVIMSNFSSKALNRTFEKVVFVSTVSVVD